MARRLMPAFADVDVVVVNAAGCGSAMKEYSHWLPDDTARVFYTSGCRMFLRCSPAAICRCARGRRP